MLISEEPQGRTANDRADRAVRDRWAQPCSLRRRGSLLSHARLLGCVLAVSLTMLGCDGGRTLLGPGPSGSPQDPGDVNFDEGRYDVFFTGMHLENLEFDGLTAPATIETLSVLLNGTQLAQVTYSSPVSVGVESAARPGGHRLDSGSYVVEVRIDSQTVNPSYYGLNSGSTISARDPETNEQYVFRPGGLATEDWVQGWLETGESLRFEFVLP